MKYSDSIKQWICSEILDGVPIIKMSQEFSIHPNTIHKWLINFRDQELNHNRYNSELIKNYQNLINENSELKEQLLLQLTKKERFKIIEKYSGIFSTKNMCSWLGVSESGYYKYKKKQ